MSTQTIPASYTQTDEALRLLADLYARRFQSATPSQSQPRDMAYWHACERIRDVLYQATHQQDALERLLALAEQVEASHASNEEEANEWRATVGKAHDLVAQVLLAGGSAQVLLAGESDGFRHLCLLCSQNESNFQRVRYFNQRARRKLLKVEARNASRSLYTRCQVCKQVLVPLKYVVLIPAGTIRHQKGCACATCNQAGVASLVNLYACDETSRALLLPRVAQIAAPSRKQASARTFSFCGQQGWYVLFDRDGHGDAR